MQNWGIYFLDPPGGLGIYSTSYDPPETSQDAERLWVKRETLHQSLVRLTYSGFDPSLVGSGTAE